MKAYILVLSIFLMATIIHATPGDLDRTFSRDGKLTDWAGSANGVAIQPDGKIVVVGTDANIGAFAVARYNPDGSPDTSFGGGDGKVTTDIGFSYESANAVALQSDGKILAVGTTWDGSGTQWGHFSLIRYDPDGSLDLTFGGGDGIVVTENLGTGWVAANSVAIQADGKIVAAGQMDYYFYDFPELAVIRYNPDGTLDLPFGGGGIARIPWAPGPLVEDAKSVAIQPDGRIVAAGYSYGFWDFSALVRLNSNGSLDGTFGGGDGVVLTDVGPEADVANSVRLQPDGKVVTAGFSGNGSNSRFAVVRYDSNGSLDTTFDHDGIVTTQIGANTIDRSSSMAIQSDGKVLAAGSTYDGQDIDFALARYNVDGSLDNTFGGGDGKATVDFNNANDAAFAIALDKAGRAVVVGKSNTDFAIARFLLTPRSTPFDFDGDGLSDVSVFRPSEGTWYLDRSTAGFSAAQFGLSTDKITPADYDGDGKTDIAVFREGTWFWLDSINGSFHTFEFGLAGDVPVPADYTGDGRADPAIYRGGTWWTYDLSNGQTRGVQFGISEDNALPADYDGDSKADLAVFRPSNGYWYILRSSDNDVRSDAFGADGDVPLTGDFNGDGLSDLAVFRPSNGTWYIARPTGVPAQNFDAIQFGISTDIPVPADYDGDSKTDIAVYRNGTWYLLQSTSGFSAQQFGLANDLPVPAAFLP